MEGNILLFLQENVRNDFLTPIMKVITSLGTGGIFWIILTLLLLCFSKTRKAGICAVLALLLSVILNNLILKNLIARIRPYEVIESLERIVSKESEYSFPSGHAATAFAAVTAIAFYMPKKVWIPLLVLAVMIGFSRLYVGVHYPTDVLAGMVSGAVCGFAGVYLEKKLLLEEKIAKVFQKHKNNKNSPSD